MQRLSFSLVITDCLVNPSTIGVFVSFTEEGEECFMTDFLEKTKQIGSIISDLSDVDVTVLNEKNDIIFRFSIFLFNDFFRTAIKHSFKIINENLKKQSDQTVFYFMDSLYLNYVSVGFWEEGKYLGAIIIGPYLSSIPDEAFIREIINKNKFSYDFKHQLSNTIDNMIILNKKKIDSISKLLVSLEKFPHVVYNESFLTASHFSKEIQDAKSMGEENFSNAYQMVEERYNVENKLLEAVKNGDEEACKEIFSLQSFISQISYRIPHDPLRSLKNLHLGFNSVLRKYAEKGGVHPFYLDAISARYSIEIEHCKKLAEMRDMGTKMVYGYCHLVKKYSLNEYSPLVKETINLIASNYASQIKIEEAAKLLHVTPAHLSRKLKKETNYNFTQLILNKRIEQAKFLLVHSRESITDIAIMLGFSDLNYFSRIFKRYVGITPTVYRDHQIPDDDHG